MALDMFTKQFGPQYYLGSTVFFRRIEMIILSWCPHNEDYFCILQNITTRTRTLTSSIINHTTDRGSENTRSYLTRHQTIDCACLDHTSIVLYWSRYSVIIYNCFFAELCHALFLYHYPGL